MLAGGDYYYVRSRVKAFGMLEPEVVERQVVAISFDDAGTSPTSNGSDLQDGKVVALSRRVTDSSVVGNGFLRQMLGNFGNFNPADIFAVGRDIAVSGIA